MQIGLFYLPVRNACVFKTDNEMYRILLMHGSEAMLEEEGIHKSDR